MLAYIRYVSATNNENLLILQLNIHKNKQIEVMYKRQKTGDVSEMNIEFIENVMIGGVISIIHAFKFNESKSI